eukprot:Awhi_evm1s8840
MPQMGVFRHVSSTLAPVAAYLRFIPSKALAFKINNSNDSDDNINGSNNDNVFNIDNKQMNKNNTN